MDAHRLSPAAFDAEFHQAVGMVSVQLATTTEAAEVRLRQYAAGARRPLTDIAQDVVARRLRLQPR